MKLGWGVGVIGVFAFPCLVVVDFKRPAPYSNSTLESRADSAARMNPSPNVHDGQILNRGIRGVWQDTLANLGSKE